MLIRRSDSAVRRQSYYVRVKQSPVKEAALYGFVTSSYEKVYERALEYVRTLSSGGYVELWDTLPLSDRLPVERWAKKD